MMDKIKGKLKKIKIILPLIVLWSRIKLLIYSYFNLPKEVKVPLNGKNEYVFFNTRNWATANLCKNNTEGSVLNYEPDQREAFIYNVKSRENKITFDIGTQIGFYAVIAAKLGAEKVFAFDIDASFSRIVEKHSRRNDVGKRVKFVHAAIGASNEKVETISLGTKVSARGLSLDSFCAERNLWPDFIKMDIEGFELEALENAEKVLDKKPIVLLGLHPRFITERKRDPGKVIEILLDQGYKITVLTKPFNNEEVVIDNFRKFLTGDAVDFICIP